ncbi:T-cell receptor beta-1 chain C region [Collichthys lucidus]|nr:T-cell receptor beta-1 chain C region [Collichthys lucidus]
MAAEEAAGSGYDGYSSLQIMIVDCEPDSRRQLWEFSDFLLKDEVSVTLELKLSLEKELKSLFWCDKVRQIENNKRATELSFCHSRRALCSFAEAFFGSGTKLTVLDSNHSVTLPKVKVLKPSDKECEGRKDKKYKKKTLVCLVYGFYPDHVNVFWLIDGVKVTDGVATDNTAQKAGQHYKITSRLTVGLREWLTEGANFTCAVNFFRGNGTVQRWDSIIGVDDRVNRGKYSFFVNLNSKLQASTEHSIVHEHFFFCRQVSEDHKQRQTVLRCSDLQEQHLRSLCGVSGVVASAVTWKAERLTAELRKPAECLAFCE